MVGRTEMGPRRNNAFYLSRMLEMALGMLQMFKSGTSELTNKEWNIILVINY